MKIETVEFHKQQIESCNAELSRRREQMLDGSDCALSDWADSAARGGHSSAINYLLIGAAEGFDGPGCVENQLFYGDERVDAVEIDGQFGRVWMLGDEAADWQGRKFIPTGENSRIQKKAGLREIWVTLPASRYMKAACCGVGMPVNYYAVPRHRYQLRNDSWKAQKLVKCLRCAKEFWPSEGFGMNAVLDKVSGYCSKACTGEDK
jgi:hypothetical protein